MEDLEPFPDRPEPGDVFTPGTFWINTTDSIVGNERLPHAICAHVTARVTASSAAGEGRSEWVADLGGGCTTMLRGDHAPGDNTLHGCLMWDRYLWTDYRTEPTGRLLLVSRAGFITQRCAHIPTQRSGWFVSDHNGPLLYIPTDDDIPDSHDVRFNVLLVETTNAQ
ncbi:hypothetical protein [Gordonia polyisoprenivorans]|uniref:hypothetical protein n=1 Tax=Gordonia polyisoprenivorans TaxID=84595 RepID=UPI0022FFE6E1|nr:hypothetical protein [Gordonia polyisoprenivorans]WCB39464.1 hypothetical protein PHA63_10330 [Gordonia polyisoprenivorans]